MGDLAFVQHMVATLNAKGRCGVVMPHGVLFRGSGDGRIREGMLKADLFEAIIGLPENLFAGTGIPATVLILNKAKAPKRRSKVLFINGAKEFEERPKKNIIGEANITRLVDAFKAWTDEDRFCRVVDLAEIAENDFNPQYLPLYRHVGTGAANRRASRTSEALGSREGAGRGCGPHERPSGGDGLCPGDLPKGWVSGRFRDAMRLEERREPIDPAQTYKLLGVRWYGNGAFLREERLGQGLSAQHIYRVKQGDVIYNRLFAWKGSFGLIGENLAGCYVSKRVSPLCSDVGQDRSKVSYAGSAAPPNVRTS